MAEWPGHQKIAEALSHLREILREYAVTTERLARERRTLADRAEAALADANSEYETRAAANQAQLEAAWSLDRERLQERFDQRLERIAKAEKKLLKQAEHANTARHDQISSDFQQTIWSSNTNYNSTHTTISREFHRRKAALNEVSVPLAKLEAACQRMARFASSDLPDLRGADDAPGFDADYDTPEAAVAALAARLAAVEVDHLALRQRHRLSSAIGSAAGLSLLVMALLMIAVTGALWLRLVEVPQVLLYASLLLPVLAIVLVPWGWYAIYRRRLQPDLPTLWEELSQLHWLSIAAEAMIDAAYTTLETAAEERLDRIAEESEEQRAVLLAEAVHEHLARREAVQHKATEAREMVDRCLESAIARAREGAVEKLSDLNERQPEEQEELQRQHALQLQQDRRDLDEAWEQHKRQWLKATTPHCQLLEQAQNEGQRLFPPLEAIDWESWKPPAGAAPAVPFGTLDIELGSYAGRMPDQELLPLPGLLHLRIPGTIDFPASHAMLIESASTTRDAAISVLQQVMLRLLTCSAPGRIGFTIIDPIGLGQSFAGFMHLADYDEAFVGRRIWTENRHIEQQLADINEHMEKVIQKYLRNEYETIAEFNETAGEMAERYRFVVICDFPANFTDAAAQRLSSIISSGSRCGVFVLLHKDRKEPPPRGFDMAELRRQSVYLSLESEKLIWRRPEFEELPLLQEPTPDRDQFTRILQRVGESVEEALRVEVDFALVAPGGEEWWSRDSASGLEVPIGKSGASKRQELELGHGTSQHAIIAGKTGSGKSTLFHVMITNLALWYGPDDVEFYLVDFKKGVEFKPYARGLLPHVRAVAIESDRDFGLSILQRIDEELRRRGERFRDLEVQNLAAYRAHPEGKRLPRTLLIIDEFQELFTEDDRIAQEAALLLDRIVRQGRAFGIHVILGSQTLGGAYSLARTTMGQMTVRIALQCSEADSYLILSDDNGAARLLNRPGEAIYNDSSGMVEGNTPFQVCWLDDHLRDEYLQRIADHASQTGIAPRPAPIVFEGNAPARLEENLHLLAALKGETSAPAEGLRLWLGAPNTIKPPVHIVLEPLSAQHLLIVGQNLPDVRGIVNAALISLAEKREGPAPRVILIDGSPPDAPDADAFQLTAQKLKLDLKECPHREIDDELLQLDRLLLERQGADEAGQPILCIIFGLQRFRQLRFEDDFGFSGGDTDKPPTPDKLLDHLLTDGAEMGIHLLVWCDSTPNLTRTLSRRAINSFAWRILFQMSVTDSTTLIDQPDAARLGMHLALLADESHGRFEKFRPYMLTDDGLWSRL